MDFLQIFHFLDQIGLPARIVLFFFKNNPVFTREDVDDLQTMGHVCEFDKNALRGVDLLESGELG